MTQFVWRVDTIVLKKRVVYQMQKYALDANLEI